jgi:aspartate racemase
VAELAAGGCDGVVMGCTGISLILSPEDVRVPLPDSTRLLAKAALEEAVSGLPVPGRVAGKGEGSGVR